MTLTEYLDGMRVASTADELEAAIQAGRLAKPPFKHPFIGPTWSRICKVRIEAGRRICEAHPHGWYVPSFGPSRRLTVCGDTYRVGKGQNSTGVSYVWHSAEEWTKNILVANGFTQRGFRDVWGSAFNYPHRSLQNVGMVLAGKIPDPKMNCLGRPRRTSAGPVTVNRKIEAKKRANRTCPGCGDGLLWDWGCGWDGCMNFINWHCDRCPRVYTEYVTQDRLSEIRQHKAA